MTNIVPGVVWQPIDVGNRAARRKGRGLIGHVAVSGASNLVPGPLSSRSADWHFYLPKSGPAIQYIDMDVQCWATAAGNASLVAFESEGGMGTTAQVNAEPWTENQLNWAARILRYLHDTEGVPLEVMPDSRPESRGFATHRLGIDPWRVAGGEVWSSSYGKACPGDAKHAQRSEVVNRAINGIPQEDDMFSDQDRADLQTLKTIAQWGFDTTLGKGAAFASAGELAARVRSTDAGVAALLARDGSIDAAAIAAAIPHDLAQQVIDALGAKLSGS